MIKKLFLR